MKILLIDDDEELCAELSQVLINEGFEVDIAFDGLHGLEFLKNNLYQIIILDLKLPALDGYGVLQRVKQSKHNQKVLVLSGRPIGEELLKFNGTSRKQEDSILNMADLVMNKPFKVDNLIKKIKKLC